MAGAWSGPAMYSYASAARVKKKKSNMAGAWSGAAMYYYAVVYPYAASASMLRCMPYFVGEGSWLHDCD